MEEGGIIPPYGAKLSIQSKGFVHGKSGRRIS